MSDDGIDDLWRAVNELRTAVAEMTAMVREVRAMLSERCDTRAKTMADMEARISQRAADHEARLRVIEHRVWWALGAAAVIGVAASWIARHGG